INEIMYAPSTGEPEWVELYNRTDAPVNINRWRFSDAANTVTITQQDFFIEPNTFIVLTADSSILNFYSVPVPILRFNLPALNNTGDNVVIKDSLGLIIDSLTYLPSWGGNTGGRSLERFSVDNSSTDSSNWSTSAGIVKATPGRINSITPKENDLTVAEFITTLPYSIIGEEIEFKIKIKNAGTNNSPNFTINLYYDTNLDSIPQQSELLISLPQNGIISGDSVDAVYLTNQFEASENHYIALIDVSIA